MGHARKSALRAPEGASNVENKKEGTVGGEKTWGRSHIRPFRSILRAHSLSSAARAGCFSPCLEMNLHSEAELKFFT